MSVLIKGIQMPKNEPLLMKINPDGSVSITAKNDYKKYEAIPIPPCGRLIDVDALITALQELFDRRNKDAEYTGFRGAVVSWNDAICYIKDAPTIIKAEDEDK